MSAETFVKNFDILMKLMGLRTTRHGIQQNTENYRYLNCHTFQGRYAFVKTGLSRTESKKTERLQKTLKTLVPVPDTSYNLPVCCLSSY